MIVNNANLVTQWTTEPIIEGALVAIEGKSIVDFGRVGKLIDRYDDTDVLDVSGKLVVPGMIDAHTRLERSFALGRPGAELVGARYEAELDEETLYWSALVSLLDAVRSGVTTVMALISSPAAVEGSLEAVGRAFEEVRVRGSLAYAVSPRSAPSLAIAENVRRVETCRGSSSEWKQGLFGLEASSSLDDETVSRAVEAAEPLGAGFHVVLQEKGQARRLRRAGVWRHGGVAFASSDITDEDRTALGNLGVVLVQSALSGAVRGAPALDLARAGSDGLKVGVGTDGFGSSVGQEFRAASLRQRALEGESGDLARSIRLAYEAAFAANSDLATARFGPELGRVKPGARADLVVIDYRPSTPLEEGNLPEHFFWGASRAPVASVVVKGRLLYHNGRFAGLDEERIRARARESAKKLWDRL